jgi:tetratricopeptide (TPR) repeat protein
MDLLRRLIGTWEEFFRFASCRRLGSLDFARCFAMMLPVKMPKKNSSRRRLSRQEQQDLDVEIGFIEGVVKRDSKFIEALQILGDDYTRRGRLTEGLKIDEQLIQLRPQDPVAHYNLACSYSLTEQYDQAISALDKAISLGYRDLRWLTRDPDLRNLRKHPLYQNIRAKLKSMIPSQR